MSSIADPDDSPALRPSHPQHDQYDDSDEATIGPGDVSSTTSMLEKSEGSASIIEGQRKIVVGMNWYLALPTLIVVIVSGGLASLLLYWLISHKPAWESSIIQDGAFLLNEGITTKGDIETARLMGLTIASAASHIISYTTSFLMSLFAYRVAAKWLKASTGPAERNDGHAELPTPLQFGLLSTLLSAPTPISIATSVRYLMTSKRAHSPSTVKETLAVAITVYAISHAIGIADLWLHGVASTSVVPLKRHITHQNGNFSIAQNLCHPYPSDWQTVQDQCMFKDGNWVIDGLALGKLVASNSSDDLRAITLHHEHDLSVLVSPQVPEETAFNMTTFGSRAVCTSLNHLCGMDASLDTFDCPSFGVSGFPPALQNVDDPDQLGVKNQAALDTFTSTCDGCTPTMPTVDTGTLNRDGTTPQSINPIRVYMQFVWQQELGENWNKERSNPAISIIGHQWKTMIANCSLAFYNVTLMYHKGAYKVLSETLSNTGLSDGLAGPTSLGHYSDRLLSNVEGLALSSLSAENTTARLSQELSRLSLASAAAITNIREPTTDNYHLFSGLLGQYPVAPSLLLVGLLYLYALLALLIFLNVSLTTTSTTVTLSTKPREKIASMEIAQLTLAQPLALAAEMFMPSDPGRRATISLSKKALHKFEEAQDGGTTTDMPERVRIGVHQSPDGGSLRFGIWQRSVANITKGL